MTTARQKRYCPRRVRGLTLIELLVGLALLAVLALISWRGLDALMATESRSRERSNSVALLQTSLAQWRTDLDAAVPTGEVSELSFDGRVLRLTRTDADGTPGAVRVVGWARRAGAAGSVSQWQRWQSPPLYTRQAVRQAWEASARWATATAANQAAATQENGVVTLTPLVNWEIYYFRNNSWSNPLSSEGASSSVDGKQSPGANNTLETLPDAVRVVLELPSGPGVAGRLSVDWLRPNYSRSRS